MVGKYLIDQQQIKEIHDEKIKKIISITDLKNASSVLSKGVDFTNQMKDLVNENKTVATIKEALLIKQNNESNL